MDMKLGFMIYRVSWEKYDDEGCCEVFYTDWHIDKKVVESMRKELLQLAKVSKTLVHVGDIIEEFVVCTKDELDELIGRAFPLKEE